MSEVYRRVKVPALLLAAFVLISGCNKAEGGQKKTDVVPVRVEPARSSTLVSDVLLAGEVQADVEVRVFSLVPERILTLKFEEGDRVKRGQVLAVIKGGALYQAVRQAKAGLAAAKTQRALAKIELERMRRLYKTGTVAIAALQRAQTQYEVAQAQVAQMQAAVGQTYTNIANVVIRAPIDGVIGRRFLNKGDLAAPQTPLCTIIQTTDVRVKAMATEYDVVKLKKGQPVKVTVPAFRGQAWSGKVDYISPVIDTQTRSAWVTVLVKNPDRRLRPGMFADMKVKVGERHGVVMTRSRALVRWMDAAGQVTYKVFLVSGNQARERSVEIGRREGDYIEITKGLKEGEPVVVLGNYRLKDKLKVKVVENPSPSRAEAKAKPATRTPAAMSSGK